MTGVPSRATAPAAADFAGRTRHHIALRLLPFVFLLYVTNYLLRTSVAYAAIGMARDLGFDDRVFGLGIGISSSAMWPCKYRARCWSNDGARAGCFAPR